MTDIPALSVLVPAYNAGKHLEEAMASVLAQDFTDFELVIINDGSTDDTDTILARVGADPRVRVLINERNLGLIGTLNRGLGECRAQLIARMDADDICEQDRFSRQIDFLRNNPAIDIVGGALRFFGNVPQPNVFRFPATHDDIRPAMLFYCPLAHPALMFRRTLVDRQLFRYDDRFRHAEDYHLWSRLLLEVKAANLQDVVLNYRLHATQVSSGQANHQYEASLRVRKSMLDEAGVAFTDDDILLHESVILEKPPVRTDYLDALASWFTKLEAGNRASGYWQPESLHQLLRVKFKESAARVGANLDALAMGGATASYVSSSDAAQPPVMAPARSLRSRVAGRLRSLLWRLRAAIG